MQANPQTNVEVAASSISGPQDSDWLSARLYGFEDPSWAKEIETLTKCEEPDCAAEGFKKLETKSPDFGFTQNRLWLRIQLKNTSPDTTDWVLHIHENFLQLYEVYVLRENGDIEVLDTQNPKSVFSDRQTDFPELATPFTFAPDENITLFISYWSGGSSKISLSLETEESFAIKSLNSVSKNFMSYGIMFILILASLLALAIIRLRVFWAYCVYVIVTLLFLMHSDGVAFQYFWPKLPTFNSYFSIIIGLAFAIVPYNFARIFLRTQEFHPRLDKLMVWMMIITPCLIIPGAIFDPQATKKYLMLLVMLAIVLGTIAGLIAAKERFREVRFYLFAWIVGLASAGLMNLRHFTDMDIGQSLELDSIRVSIVIDAIMMGMGVADRYRQQVKAARDEERHALQQAQQNLRLNTRLQNLEEQYRLATELVTSRDQDLKNTVHDLRQPLHALRLNVLNLQSQSEDIETSLPKFEDTFTYLETLIAGFLEDSVQDSTQSKAPAAIEHETLSLSNILQSIYDMFLPDAQEKGLDFRFANTSTETTLEALPLMRMVTNLVANAVKYTPSGKILLGVRRDGAFIRIEVHDTGVGMSREDFDKAKDRTVRLKPERTSGQGFGLSIVTELAKQTGSELHFYDRAQTGTSLAIKLPRKIEAPYESNSISISAIP